MVNRRNLCSWRYASLLRKQNQYVPVAIIKAKSLKLYYLKYSDVVKIKLTNPKTTYCVILYHKAGTDGPNDFGDKPPENRLKR